LFAAQNIFVMGQDWQEFGKIDSNWSEGDK
jgi:hypothetical protein